MNKIERIQAVKAMEFLMRNLNDEMIFEGWLMDGVADGDIDYGDLSVKADDEENLYVYYEDDENFAELIDTFMWCMGRARKSGGLYIDGVVSGEREKK